MEKWTCECSNTHSLVWIQELSSCISGQHVDDDHLAPLFDVYQEIAQLTIVLVDEVDALWADLLERHDDAAGDQLRSKVKQKSK